MDSSRELTEIKEKIMAKKSASMPTSELTYQTLKKAILYKILRPGFRLKEEEISKDLGVSRTPVREAMYRLQADGLIISQPRIGFSVIEFSSQDILDIYVAREVLEGTVTRLAAYSVTPLDLSILHNMIGTMQEYHKENDDENFLKTNKKFHKYIFQASKNKTIIKMLDDLHNTIQLFKNSSSVDYEKRIGILEEHRKILEALEKRDGDMAEKIARAHVKKALARIINDLEAIAL